MARPAVYSPRWSNLEASFSDSAQLRYNATMAIGHRYQCPNKYYSNSNTARKGCQIRLFWLKG